MLLTANFKGNNIDNLDGEIKLLNSSFTKYSKQLEIYDFSLKTFIQNSAPAIALRTDFIDASLEGRYNFSSLSVVAGIALADMFPSKFSIPEKLFKPRDNIFKYSVTFKNTDRLNDFLRTGLRISENSSISGNVYRDSLFTLNARSRLFSRGTVAFNDLSINAVYSAKKGLISVKTTNLDLSGLAGLNNFNINASAEKDNFIVSGKWDSNQKVVNSGSFEAHGLFVGTEEPGKGTKMEIEIRPSDIYVKDDTWKIAHARILTDSTSVKVEGFRIGTEKSFFTVNGAVSADLRDTLKLGFSDLNLNPVNYLYEKKLHNDPNMIHLALGGRVNGEVSITNILRSFMFQSNIAVNNFTLLGSEYGTIDIGSVWNPENSVADISIGNNFNGKNMFMIGGTYDPASKNAVLEIVTNKMPVDILNPLLKSFASGISGTATGKVRMTGALNQPVLNGSVWAENGQLKIDYLQTKYRFSDSIRFNSKGIEFRNIQVKDERNNIALFAGMVYHKYFKNFTVDLNMKTNETMVLNTRPKDNELFYGTAYASGVTTIKTKGNILEFGISAKTGKNTRFFIPLNSGMNISDNRSVTFITRDTSSKKDAPVPLAKSVSAATLMELSIDLEVTPDAELQLIMDPKAGDIMKGKGAGNLNVSLDRKGVFKIFGDYLINNGDYLFTLGNIINKPFSVNPGGRITFNGDLENAEIDIKAIYSTKAALYDIMPGIPDPKLKERIPVECQLLLSGKLFNPVVGFEINLPTADEETRAYLRSMIKSEEEMSRQFLFLLVMNKFYSDPQAGIATSTAAMGTTTVGVTTMEMFSSQISNWLSQISNNFDIDMNYRPGTSDLPNSDELQLALSTQLLNDKVKINGNFDVAGSNANLNNPVPGAGNSQITGAFDIEYSINEKVKFKFFNRSNDNFYTNNGVQYTQGLGLFFRQDFNRLRDLFRPSKKNTDKKGRK
jgi:hypothetical protein